MTPYNTLNVKLSNSQLNKLRSGTINGAEVTLKLSANAVGGSFNENNFPHKLLLPNREASEPCKVFTNNSSTNIKLQKIQLHKIGQPGGYLCRFSGLDCL